MKRAMGMLLAFTLTAGIFIAIVFEPRVSTDAVATPQPALVYVKKNTSKYHGQECHLLQGVAASDIIAMSRDEAESLGYEPCRNPKCFPR
ncbi:MAG TPA: hypothetical protein VNN73_20225 [Blastocatellia bacterium]|nr:hypothetical protein [Blastocatellia bacterium]